MAGSFYLRIGTLSIRMILATSKKKKKSNWLKQMRKIKGKTLWIPSMALSQCLNDPSDRGVCFLSSSVTSSLR